MNCKMDNWIEELQDIISNDSDLIFNSEHSNRVFDLVRTSIEDKGMQVRSRVDIENYVSFFKDMLGVGNEH